MKLLLVSAPKTGNVWLERLLAKIYNLPIVDLTSTDQTQIPDIAEEQFISHQHYLPIPELLAWAEKEEVRFLTILRHPADIFVSLYHYVNNFAPFWEQQGWIGKNPSDVLIGQPIDSPVVLDFLKTTFKRETIDKSLAWLNQENCLVTRYEDLHANPVESLKKITNQIQPTSLEIIEQAIEACRIEKMQQENELMRLHCRRGKVGSWRDELNQVHLAIFQDYYAEELAKLGYEVAETKSPQFSPPAAVPYLIDPHKQFAIDPNQAVGFFSKESQWLNPVQLGASTLSDFGSQASTIEAVLSILNLLETDSYIEFMKQFYQNGLEVFGDLWGYRDQLTLLYAAAKLCKPKNYLEIGVFRGRSMAVVANVAPDCHLYGFDLWIRNYSGLDNPGPEFVRTQIERVGHRGPILLTSGDSKESVPQFLSAHPDLFFDLVTVDGDHTEEGARIDLENVLPRIKLGGILIFDDINHPQFPWLEQVWDEVVGTNANFSSQKYTQIGHGIACAVRHRTDTTLDKAYGTTSNRFASLDLQLRKVTTQSEWQQAQIAERNKELATLKILLQKRDEELVSIKPVLQARDEELTSIKPILQARDEELAAVKSLLQARDEELAAVKSLLQAKDEELASIKAELQTREKELDGIYHSRSWKLAQKVSQSLRARK